MQGLSIGWEYLTGCCVATDPANRKRVEWPPHPGRVFMALAAAWFETGENQDQGEALRWLEKLGDPLMLIPPAFAVYRRKVVDVYVPVNDQADPYDWQDKQKKPTIHMNLGSVAFGRARQPRTFPSVWVGDALCYLNWPKACDEEVQRHRMTLAQLCGEVTRIGHSSSLVRMWVAEDFASTIARETWVPDDALAEVQARRMTEGTLTLLDRQFNRRGREDHSRLAAEIAALTARKKSIRGRGASAQKSDIERDIETYRERLCGIDASDAIRAKLGLWTGYRREEAEPPPPIPHTVFDSDLLILTQTNGPRLPVASTLAVTQALRGAAMTNCEQHGIAIPDWVSGHKPNGEPLRNGNQHMAFIPLPFVGHEHADGHLLGLGLVFPRVVPRPERGKVLGRLLVSETGEPREIELRLGRVGVWTVRKRDWMEHRNTLRPETWTAHPSGAKMWATVTPVVLDRFPKHDPVKREAWQDEVVGIITTACERIGLPAPIQVAVGTTSWHRGSPRAVGKRRSLRNHPELHGADAALGDGFRTYPTKGGNGARPQLHVCLRFVDPVIGPVLLCAGRFLGYGLCKPLWGGADR